MDADEPSQSDDEGILFELPPHHQPALCHPRCRSPLTSGKLLRRSRTWFFFNTHHLDGEYSWVLQSWKTIKQVNTVGYSIQLISNWYKLMNSWVKYTQFPVATAPIENCLSVSCRWGEHGNSCLPVTWSGIIETVWHPQNSSRLDRAITAVFFDGFFFTVDGFPSQINQRKPLGKPKVKEATETPKSSGPKVVGATPSVAFNATTEKVVPKSMPTTCRFWPMGWEKSQSLVMSDYGKCPGNLYKRS